MIDFKLTYFCLFLC